MRGSPMLMVGVELARRRESGLFTAMANIPEQLKEGALRPQCGDAMSRSM